MKNRINAVFITVLLCSASISKAQTVNYISLKDIKAEYVQIVGTSRQMSSKLTAELDFGQENKATAQATDANGKPLVWTSMIEGLNFMSANGYEFVQAYAIAMGTQQNIYHFLLRRKK